MTLLGKLGALFLSSTIIASCYSAPKRRTYQEEIQLAEQRIATLDKDLNDFNESTNRVDERIKEKDREELIQDFLELGKRISELRVAVKTAKKNQRYNEILKEDPGKTNEERFKHKLRLIEHFPYGLFR